MIRNLIAKPWKERKTILNRMTSLVCMPALFMNLDNLFIWYDLHCEAGVMLGNWFQGTLYVCMSYNVMKTKMPNWILSQIHPIKIYQKCKKIIILCSFDIIENVDNIYSTGWSFHCEFELCNLHNNVYLTCILYLYS